MADSIELRIIDRVKKARRGSIYFTESFLKFGNAKAVSKALERLTHKGELRRIATGLYARPIMDPIIGPVNPPVDAIARAISKRDRARIIPSGDYALNLMGLSTQVPLQVVYLTDGSTRNVKIGKRSITFVHTAPKYLTARGELSGLALQALRTLGKNRVDDDEILKIQGFLKNEKKAHLEHDKLLAPVWIQKIFDSVLNQLKE
ncbi:MAG: DUF6088 family protein [Bacteroidia bacterium]|nr:DUF6088 family protein [Bacteroidia bacterium]